MRSRAFALVSALALCAIAASAQLLLGSAVRADKGPSDAAFDKTPSPPFKSSSPWCSRKTSVAI